MPHPPPQDPLLPLERLPPFDLLPKARRDALEAASDIVYFPAGHRLSEAGAAPDAVYLIIKGRILARWPGPDGDFEDSISELLGPGALAGGRERLASPAERPHLEVQEECLARLLPGELFDRACAESPAFRTFFASDLVAKRHAMHERESNRELASFMMARIKEAYLHPPVRVPAETTLRQTARILREHKATSVLVEGVANAEQLGLVTASDLIDALAIEERGPHSPVGAIATRELIGLPPDDSLFNALLLMTRHGISRVIVREPGQAPTGILEQKDLLSYFSSHSHLVVVQIERATGLEDLEQASLSLLPLLQSLNAKGVRARYIARLVSELNRKLMARLMDMLFPADWKAHLCLMVMGSEGRGEQLLRTDQDNGLIRADGFAPPELDSLAQAFTQALLRLGYPPCPGGIMLSNPAWRLELSDWKHELRRHIDHPDADTPLRLSILYDAQPVWGNAELLHEARRELSEAVRNQPLLLPHLARSVLAFDTPLGLFSHFVVEKGSHRDQLDLKKGGLFALMHGIRVLAFDAGVQDTGTLDRIRALQARGLFNERQADDLCEAFDFLTGLRLRGMLRQIQNGEEPDNYIDPRRLNSLEQDLLRDALRQVDQLKKLVAHHFHLHRMT
ncbi:MAG: putative nucleotidyltransferase substrate binding domain-containing protein [Halothiobacillaceae bacterium]|nr:putative nucleotidyltransferase substrate binding domain-containing protein [Halothiobacillaceae bacterium]